MIFKIIIGWVLEEMEIEDDMLICFNIWVLGSESKLIEKFVITEGWWGGYV